MEQFIIKRFFDLYIALIGLVVFSPCIIIVSLLVKNDLGSPVIFKQKRVGKDDQIFNLYKFRTMNERCDRTGKLLPDSERLTKFGILLRSTSLDELPTLLNVLQGHLSIVGPRPLLVRYLERYSTEQRRRHEVKPGITGWAQIHGRNSLSWDEKFKLDVWYVDNQSLWLDIKITLYTIKAVLIRDGINEPGRATMSEFFGKKI